MRNEPGCCGASRSVFIGGGGGHQVDELNAFRDPGPVRLGLPAFA